MQAVVKMPHIKINIQGDIPPKVISVLKEEYGKNVKLTGDTESDLVDIFETTWFKEIKSQITPGNNLKIYRENKGLTQNALGELLGGIPRQHVSNMENGKRSISLKMAKKLSEIFDVSVEKFV